ncbi:LysR family transcriptional regulator [Photobacterium aquimaris]|uniref:LysR family transcriptional regulator n=1 Tax=Photobacterium aquimaris TaxID=512643 RepID=A0A2T3IIJ0_9GAMM|nr:LysR family transcriptional regulator [Photobacterium aquimaris]OBU15773.1 LysR family transcriptional regulator [Photobacterium aquimaris]PSU28165.1 LysR family transcriptional regulator [Photobacterium aquimaris]
MLLQDLEVILKVAEFRSITLAATHLDMRIATASAAVKRVEASLGVELFIRTTRQLRLSPAGEQYIPQCEQAMLILKTAKQNVREDLGIIDGEIRIALSSDLGRNIVIPWLDDFLEQHPKVSLRASISDRNIDFYHDSVDMALRYGSPSEANVYGFKICTVPRVLCASPEYLEKYGTPLTLEDLGDHNALLYQLDKLLHDEWVFTEHGNTTKVKLIGNRASDDADLVRRWCVAGLGVALKSSLDMSKDLLSGNVVSIMPNYQPIGTELWLICPSRQSITPTVRLLRDHLRAQTKVVLDCLVEQGIVTADMLK